MAAAATAALLSTVAPAASARPSSDGPGHGPWHARLLGAQVVDKGLVVDGTRVGELSSIDYDRATGAYYLVADDTESAPARFYTARMRVGVTGIHDVRFVRATWLRRSDGTLFPPLSSSGTELADPESLRLDPTSRTLYWGSEGKRVVPEQGKPQLVDPWVRQASLSGTYLRELRLPRDERMSAEPTGPRDNLVFEGLTLSTDHRWVVASDEGALYQDGPIATVKHGATNRITWWNKRRGRAVKQLAYPLSRIPKAPRPSTASADNGISALLAVDRHHYLVVERSYASGVGNTIRVFEIDTRGATNVLHRESLSDGHYRPVSKRLVVDLGTIGLDHLDNIEGVTWGPRLPTGERTLVFVSDDNFNDSQVTQLVAVAVRP
ncbi:MAG: esterase-like activity of phytase family protein [Streptosporangiales bacterium]